MLRRLLLTVMMAGFVLMLQPGCGSGTQAPVAAKPDTAVQSGAICDTTLGTAAAAGIAVRPDTLKPEPAKKLESEAQKPKPEPEKVAEKPKELPKMWDFGSTTCLPCKTMKEILDPMIVDYKGKVDVRIINVYEETELTKQFRISVIPTQVFIDAAGKELYRHVGVYPRDSIESCFKRFDFPIVANTAAPAQTPATGST
jgi:thiol-disulfide isomerase/thioredoxin